MKELSRDEEIDLIYLEVLKQVEGMTEEEREEYMQAVSSLFKMQIAMKKQKPHSN